MTVSTSPVVTITFKATCDYYQKNTYDSLVAMSSEINTRVRTSSNFLGDQIPVNVALKGFKTLKQLQLGNTVQDKFIFLF